ncbi:MAG: hypothetical protein ACI8RD_014498, partial [Bacillariaceae sp.]
RVANNITANRRGLNSVGKKKMLGRNQNFLKNCVEFLKKRWSQGRASMS